MASTQTLSPNPSQVFSWSGFSLTIPTAWNLTLHRGTARRGAAVLSDLHQTQLEIRWQTLSPRRAPRHLRRMLDRLHQRGATMTKYPTPVPSYSVQHKELSLLLIQGVTRIYELVSAGATTDEILTSFADHSQNTDWPWEIYGMSGLVPASCRLTKATFLPGRSQLDFAGARRRISLGSWSLADRVLGTQTLREWAQRSIPWVRNQRAGAWTTDGPRETFTMLKVSPFFRRSITLTLELVPQHNLIRWRQLTGPARHGKPKEAPQ